MRCPNIVRSVTAICVTYSRLFELWQGLSRFPYSIRGAPKPRSTHEWRWEMSVYTVANDLEMIAVGAEPLAEDCP
jgi:hypothetical protein